LLAAEQTFARDGYEAARLEDIAARAGYTRGAFYANFDSKEDIFFALLEQWVAQQIAEVNEKICEARPAAGGAAGEDPSGTRGEKGGSGTRSRRRSPPR